MNYQYIEQLLERYFECKTTLQEEQILKAFFSQEDVPVHLLQYRELFMYETEAQQETLGEDFDHRMMKLVDSESTVRKAHVVKMNPRLAPFFKAAAVVAVAITIGNAAEHAIGVQEAEVDAAATSVVVDPYIKSANIRNAIRVKDISRAENNAVKDSTISVQTEEEVQ